MKNLFSLLLLMLFTSSVILAQKETRSLSAFDKLDVSGSISVELVKSSNYKAEITIIKGDLEALVTEVNGGTLDISFKRLGGYNWGSGEKAKIILYTGDLASIETSAGAKVDGKTTSNTSNTVSLEASSGSSIAISVESNQVKADASSGARISVSGNTSAISADVSSGANIDCSLLKAESASADASSGGSISVWPTESLKAEASSGGSVKYKGEPSNLDVEKDKYSGGNISKL